MKGFTTRKWATILVASFSCLVSLAFGHALKNTFCPVVEKGSLEDQPSCRQEGSDLICDGDITLWSPGQMPNVIQTLTINSTKIKSLPACSFYDFSIEKIVIEDNLDLVDIDRDAFVGIENLNTLIIRKNPILNLPNLFRVFRSLNRLENLILDENSIQYDVDDFEEVLEDQVDLSALTSISLFGNPLKNITISLFKPLLKSPLQELNLQNCQIEVVEKGTFVYTFTKIEFTKFFYCLCLHLQDHCYN